ncbi:MAG: efflux RND transporter periplasmic adaptor subunit [Alphaproteobacteria bacterium]|nr:efflux RND transporter periplasmic adaptor subunit [Alphaproteobacteria bacterium]
MKINYPNLLEVAKKIAIFLLCAGCGWYLKGRLTPGGNMMGMGMGETYVVAQPARMKDISTFDNKISYIESLNEVSLLPQVTGTVEKILFEEGSMVQEGDVLFEIDASKYQAAYDLAKAKLDSANANLVKAERDYERQVKLSSEKFASKATFDSSESFYLQSKAAVEEAQANLDVALIDLNNTKVTAPISGKIGKALVTKGNYVVASNMVLAKIVQVSPIRISFSLTDKEVASLQNKDYSIDDLTAQIQLATGEMIKEKVVGVFLDNTLNAATATLSVYADVENKDDRLIPGNYVQSAISDNKPVYSIVVPQTALNYDKDGAYVYVAKIDKEKSAENDQHGIAEQRRVVIGETTSASEQIISKGLEDGELVIVQGNIKIRNDSPIRIGVLADK